MQARSRHRTALRAVGASLVALVVAGCTVGNPVAPTQVSPSASASPFASATKAPLFRPDPTPSSSYEGWTPWRDQDDAEAAVATFFDQFGPATHYRVRHRERVELGDGFLIISTEHLVDTSAARVSSMQSYAASGDDMWFELTGDDAQLPFLRTHTLRTVTDHAARAPRTLMTYSGVGGWDGIWLDTETDEATSTMLTYLGLGRRLASDYSNGLTGVVGGVATGFDAERSGLDYDVPAVVATQFLPARTVARLAESGVDASELTAVVPAVVGQTPGGLTVSLDVSPLLREAAELIEGDGLVAVSAGREPPCRRHGRPARHRRGGRASGPGLHRQRPAAEPRLTTGSLAKPGSSRRVRGRRARSRIGA